MTPYQIVYDSFLSKIKEDEWDCEADIEMILYDLRSILESAIPFFKFPKISLRRNEEGFLEDLGEDEIQIIANLMKEEWLSRTINSWENVKVMYDERDFSQANLLDKFIRLQENVQAKNRKLQKMYYRSTIDKENQLKKPFDYTKLAGGEKYD